MFTGIITDIGRITDITKNPESMSITIRTSYNTADIAIGASIACNGCCLTVTKKTPKTLSFDLSPETLNKTIFNNIHENDEINLEQSLKMGDELGGHMVSGHVDTIAEVVSKKITEGNWQVKFKLPVSYARYIIKKGSVTLNGVSLTINEVENEEFEVNIIPHSLEKTNLKNLDVGAKVNLEIDLLARYLEKLIQK